MPIKGMQSQMSGDAGPESRADAARTLARRTRCETPLLAEFVDPQSRRAAPRRRRG